MRDETALDRFLRTDPRDVGCEEAMELLHVYVELVTCDASAAERYPGIAIHLRACGPCSEDFEGLLSAVTSPGRLSAGAFEQGRSASRGKTRPSRDAHHLTGRR